MLFFCNLGYNKYNGGDWEMNIPNKLKWQVINHEIVTDDEAFMFLRYTINKTIEIVSHMYNTINYKPLFLLKEIYYSYNLVDEAFMDDSAKYIILFFNNKKYLIDLDFDSDEIKDLKKYKYVLYSDSLFSKYKKIISNGDLS